MKREAAKDIVQFVKNNEMLSSKFRVIAIHASKGLKAKSTIEKMLLQRTRGAIEAYARVFEYIGSGATEREAAKRLAAEFGIRHSN